MFDKKFFFFISLLQIVLVTAVVLDIPCFRQIFVFIFLAFVPGLIAFKALNLKLKSSLEKILFFFGLSTAILILFGVSINFLLPLVGYSTPLSLISLLFFLNILLTVGNFIACRRNLSVFDLDISKPIKLPIVDFALLLLPFSSLIGSYILKFYGYPWLSILLIVILSIVYIVGFWKKAHHNWIIAVFSFSLIFSGFFISLYPEPFDQAQSFYVFRTSQDASFWNQSSLPLGGQSPYKVNAMASVSILPVIYSNISNLSGVWVFKILFQFALVLIPLGLYFVYRALVKKSVAYVSVFFFVAISIGLGWGNDMQRLAELFYIMIFLVIFSLDLPSRTRSTLFIILCSALTLTHYSMAYILAFSLILVWISAKFIFKVQPKVSFNLIIAFSVITFGWYIYTSNSAPFDSLVQSFSGVFNNFNQLFNMQSRGTEINRFFASASTESDPWLHEISRNLFRLSIVLVVFGYLTLLIGKFRNKQNDINKFFALFMHANMLILVINLALPNLADSFLMGRFYQVSFIVLSPLCALGCSLVINWLSGFSFKKSLGSKKVSSLFMIFLVLPLFLFQSGFFYETLGKESWSVNISYYRIDKEKYYTTFYSGQEVSSCLWLSANLEGTQSNVYLDYRGEDVFLSFGSSNVAFHILSNATQQIDGYCYLRWVNVMNNTISTTYDWNTSDVASLLSLQNQVYSNGGSIIYKSPA